MPKIPRLATLLRAPGAARLARPTASLRGAIRPFRATTCTRTPCRAIDGLKAKGYRVAITANQPARRHAELEALGIRVEAMGMSDAMGVAKPDPAFFTRSLELMGSPDR